MSFRASMGVLFGCQFGTANKLLAAADKGSFTEVSEILTSRPQLAAYTGFNNSFSALHRAAATGQVDVCKAIIEPIKNRIELAEAAISAGRKKQALLKKWQNLLNTVLNQRTSRSMTPLMLACENGHPGVVAYLLQEGADPLACDWVHMRTCLHYAAMSGQVDCLRLLCSANTEVAAKDGIRALRDVVVQDIQVDTCRFIDQRAFGGLTALHFAVVTGNLEAVQALLRGGASIMVKTDGEAYIGDEYLVPGSSPLHIAVIIGNLSIVHAILQAHMENMNVVGQGLDERGRRPWEGSSRTDIRSIRNVFRRLPFHLARERGLQQLMSLVDPRIPVDVALDAARDTEHGIGPKRLSTIVSLVLQQSLLQWLDDCQAQLEKEASHRAPASLASAAAQADTRTQTPRQAGPELELAATAAGASPASEQPGAAIVRVGRPPLPRSTSCRPNLPSPSPDHAAPLEGAASDGMPGCGSRESAASEGTAPSSAAGGDVLPTQDVLLAQRSTQDYSVELAGTGATPFAAAAVPPLSLAGMDPSAVSQSAPATPSTGFLPREASAPPGSLPNPAALRAAPGESTGEGMPLQHMPSLHGYMGMLSMRRQRTRSLDPVPFPHTTTVCNDSAPRAPDPLPGTHPSRTSLQRQLSSPANMNSPREMETGPLAIVRSNSTTRNRQASDHASIDDGSSRNVTVVSGRRNSLQGNAPTIRGVLTSIRDRLRSSESLPVMASVEEMDKEIGDGIPPSPVKSEAESEVEDVECGICLDQKVDVAFAGCEHSLCLECARNLTKQEKKPPVCPFCRRMIVGFMRVSPSRHPHHTRSA